MPSGCMRAERHHALALAEQVGQDADIGHLDAGAAVGDAELARRDDRHRSTRCTLPCSTRPPRRKVRPGAGALLARSDGARKNTRLSRNADSASAVAEPRPRPQASSDPETAALAGHRRAARRGSIAASRRCAARMRRKAATRERRRDRHAQRIGRDDDRADASCGGLVGPRHQQRADAPLHHRGAGARDDDGGEAPACSRARRPAAATACRHTWSARR